MMEVAGIGEDAFSQPEAGVEEKGGNTKDTHLQEHPERPGVVQILG